MTGINHGMTGAVIALLVKEPALAVPLSFASHFACDALPHSGLFPGQKLFDKRFNITLVADFTFAVITMIILSAIFPSQRWVIWTCMIAAASPDLMWAYYHLYVQKIKRRQAKLGPLARFHAWIQWSQTPSGYLLEAAWFLLMGAVIMTRLP